MKCTMNTVAASAALLGRAALAATSGDFNVLTMNVAGLPEILNGNDVPGDKTANSRNMGSKFAAYNYDVIHVQEDFNFHAYIYETDNHPYRTATSGGVPFGSGLNTLANFDWINFERVKWDTCSNASGADCLTPKGFTFSTFHPVSPTLSACLGAPPAVQGCLNLLLTLFGPPPFAICDPG